MNYNIIAYLLFLMLMVFIIVKIGNACYRNGTIFVAALLPRHSDLCRQLNKLLRLGYYLINIGYCAATLTYWEAIISLEMLIEVIALKASVIVFTLAVLHYGNIYILKNYAHKFIH